jgi:hypothetical protein
MTPKEKAKQLVDRMYFIISNNGQFTGVHSIPNKFIEAKKCALIAVDEIIKANPTELLADPYEFYSSKGHWEQVKQEIENYD